MVGEVSPSEDDGEDKTVDLGFDPSEYGIDVESGTIDGRRVGIGTALIVAIGCHQTAKLYGSTSSRIPERNGAQSAGGPLRQGDAS